MAKFQGIGPANFHDRCDINYSDGNRVTELRCWLGSLPDLDQSKAPVMKAQGRGVEMSAAEWDWKFASNPVRTAWMPRT